MADVAGRTLRTPVQPAAGDQAGADTAGSKDDSGYSEAERKALNRTVEQSTQ